ncbi:MAG TPA: hypothetical protein VIT92_09460 [Burkholderiaceae bacterium]
MRSTRASNAVDRLKRRSGLATYAMLVAPSGHFALVQNQPDGPPERLCDWMDLDDFVAFVNAQGPQTPKRVSKLDVAFEKQLKKRPDGTAS